MKYLKRIVWVLFLVIAIPVWAITTCTGTLICLLLGVLRHVFVWEDADKDLTYYLFKFLDFVVELPEKIVQKYRPE